MADERLPATEGATSPQERIDSAIKALREGAGEHVLADAAGVVGLFAAMTVTVDAGGHSSRELEKLAPVMRAAAGIRRKTEGLLLPAGLLLLAGVVAAFTRRMSLR
eukprot:gb/GFBE01012848.1/.p1 GENE.gb/GFBE01012848.1/~~gb/GFBE01012848.1/.p1  ORF type:complete len:106 (+),score=18.32 gb/GFBE01012848.1/:1-318(+)